MMFQLVTRGLPDKDKEEAFFEWVIDAVIGQVIDAIPVVSPGIEGARQGNFSRGNENVLTGPLTKTAGGAVGLFGNNKERAFFDMLEGGGLMTGKIPATAIRRLYRSWNLLSEGEYMRAAKNMVGMKNEDRFDKVAKTLSQEFKEWKERRKSGERIPITNRLKQNIRFEHAKRRISKLRQHIERVNERKGVSDEVRRKRVSELERRIKMVKEDALSKFDEAINMK